MASGRRQRRMGPAPFASFEDLSDEVRPSADTSPPDAPRLPGINEDVASPPTVTESISSLLPTAPRIDISRASSSSHHEDSRDSTPERELFQAPGQPCARLGLAFREEGALDLRSSTEELDFQDPNDVSLQPHRTSVTVMSASSAGADPTHQRKDSQGSEFGGLLSISGRTSRLSSIGSQGSRVSDASRLSVTSGMSRSPSPHKMLLETSFCGSKTGSSQSTGGPSHSGAAKVESELLERVLLSRKHDPTEAILAEGISIECRRKIQPADSLVELSPVLQHTAQSPPSGPPPTPVDNTPINPVIIPVVNSSMPPEKPARKSIPVKVQSDVIITVDRPVEDLVEIVQNDTRKSNTMLGKTIIADSGIEYTFIPLKGPLPKETTSRNVSPSGRSSSSPTNKSPVMNQTRGSDREPQYIRIKLKPDHMYAEGDTSENFSKPASLDLSNGSAAPAPIGRSPVPNSTPSPSVSRKSSFASLFRGKDYGTSPESPTVPAATRRKTPRSRSKSSDRDRASDGAGDKPSKHRSVFTLFKSKKPHSKSKQSLTTDTSPCRQTATSLHSLEFTFDRPVKKYYEVPLDGDSIIIPLHSPGSEIPPPLSLYAPDEDCSPQEKKPQRREKIEEHVDLGNRVSSVVSHRQSSTSSENVVFSTNLGSDNEIFTTKLPKRNKDDPKPEIPQALSLPIQNGFTTTAEISNEPVMNDTEIELNEDQEKLSTYEADTSEHATVGNDSSESENENLIKSKKGAIEPEEDESSSEHERKGFVLQQDSFEDELPYIPTTLPQERSVAIPIVPIKQRATYEIRTCPIERPRSTTPINPSCLEDYCEDVHATTRTAEKLRISLPREDSITSGSNIAVNSAGRSVKSPRKWMEFAPKQKESKHEELPAPPLPPRGAPRDWINFEEIPERRKPPKRIQTIPSARGVLQPPSSSSNPEDANVVYSYVNPEDCKCECHESTVRNPTTPKTEDELPLLLSSDRRSDSSPESQSAAKPTLAFPKKPPSKS